MAEQYVHKPGKGSLFKNDNKTNDKQPDWSGLVTLQDGTVQRIAIWNTVSRNTGNPYLSVDISDPRPQASGTAAPPPLVEMTDDIPF